MSIRLLRFHRTAPWLLCATAAALAFVCASPPANAQEDVELGLDAAPGDSTLSSLGEIDDCVSAAVGASFDIGLYVRDVTDLLAFEIYLDFDPEVVSVTSRNVELLLALEGAAGDIFDLSAPVPDDDGLYNVAAVDTADPPRPDSGSGLIALITFTATGEGTSPVSFTVRDVDGDDIADVGPLLRDVDNRVIGDSDGDHIFDGPFEDISVVVGDSCDDGSTPGATTSPEPNGGEGGSSTWLFVGGAVAAVAVVGAAGALVYSRRRTVG